MTPEVMVLVATGTAVLVVDPRRGTTDPAEGLNRHDPTCLAASSGGTGVDSGAAGLVWCGTKGGGVFRSEDGGRSWHLSGLAGEHVTALTAGPLKADVVWAGTEPSALWRSRNRGRSWERAEGLRELPSSPEWSFPPRPATDHVRWIACHPEREGHLWLAIEAGALVTTPDGGRSWRDRTPGGPRDTHELAIHPGRPDTLRVAAGDGYFESRDGGSTWATPGRGLEVGYLRSVAVDPGEPDVVLVSAASRARSAYVAGSSDGRLYRRAESGPWRRILDGWTDPPETIAPLIRTGISAREGLWAADERGVHRSNDGGRSWERSATYPETPSHLRGMALTRTV